MKVVLELQEQLANVRRVTVRHDIVIGRGSDCNLRLSAPQMSRRHCFLRVGRDGVSVTDLDSSNGTYVDNKRIKSGERVELKTGSILTLGPVNFIVHLKEDSGSTTKSEGDRSRKSTKSTSGAPESSTIVSSAAAIIAEEFKSKPPLQYSVEQAGASAEAHEETARLKKDSTSDTVGKRPSSIPASSQSRDVIADIAAPAVKKAAAAAVITSVVAPIAEEIVKAESVNPSSFVDSAAESIDTDDSQSVAPESSWLTDDSPDDMSFLGGHQSDESIVPPEGPSGSAAAGTIDDVVEEVVEVLDDEDIFAEEVVEAVLAEQPVKAVEVLEDEPVEVLDEIAVEAVELLDEGIPANALTADFEEADLLNNQFVEVLEEPQVLAEELVEADFIEEIDESAEFVEVLADDEPVEVMEAVSVEPDPAEAEMVEMLDEPFDFFAELGIVDDEPQQTIEKIAAVDTVPPVGQLAAELVDTESVEEPVEAVQALDDEAAVEVLEEPSDFFDMLGIEVDEPQQVIEQVAAVEAAGSVEEWLEEPVAAELVEEHAEAVQVVDNEAAVEVLEEPSDFFDMLGIEVDEPQQVIEQVAAVEAAGSVEEWLEEPVAAELVEEHAEAVQVLENEAAAEVSEEPSDFFDMLGIEIDEPQQVIEQVAAAEDVMDVVEEQPVEAVVDDVELFDNVELLEESSASDQKLSDEGSAPEVASLEQAVVPASEPSWDDVELSEVAEPELGGGFDFLNEDPQPVALTAAAAIETLATPPVDGTQDSAVVEEFAEYEAEIEAVEEVEAVEEFDFFDEVETVPPVATVATVEQVDAVDEFDAELEEIELLEEVAEAEIVAESETATEPVAEVTEAVMEEFAVVEEVDAVEEVWDFAEIAADDVATADHESPDVVAGEEVAAEEVVEVVEEDEASNWFDIGDDKSEDDDDPELRKFLKGF